MGGVFVDNLYDEETPHNQEILRRIDGRKATNSCGTLLKLDESGYVLGDGKRLYIRETVYAYRSHFKSNKGIYPNKDPSIRNVSQWSDYDAAIKPNLAIIDANKVAVNCQVAIGNMKMPDTPKFVTSKQNNSRF